MEKLSPPFWKIILDIKMANQIIFKNHLSVVLGKFKDGLWKLFHPRFIGGTLKIMTKMDWNVFSEYQKSTLISQNGHSDHPKNHVIFLKVVEGTTIIV